MPVPVPASATSGCAQRDRARDRLRHRELLRAETESGELVRERAAVAEDRGELGVRRAGSRVVRKRSVQFAFALAFALGFACAAPFAARAGSVCFSTMATIVRMPSMRSLNSSYGNRDALLVIVVGFAAAPAELRHRQQPALPAGCAVPRPPASTRFASFSAAWYGLRNVLLLLVEAGLALRAVGAFGRLLVAELDDLDRLDVAAHRVQVLRRRRNSSRARACRRSAGRRSCVRDRDCRRSSRRRHRDRWPRRATRARRQQEENAWVFGASDAAGKRDAECYPRAAQHSTGPMVDRCRVTSRRARRRPPTGQIVQPPDTSMTAPLMYDASSEASHA